MSLQLKGDQRSPKPRKSMIRSIFGKVALSYRSFVEKYGKDLKTVKRVLLDMGIKKKTLSRHSKVKWGTKIKATTTAEGKEETLQVAQRTGCCDGWRILLSIHVLRIKGTLFWGSRQTKKRYQIQGKGKVWAKTINVVQFPGKADQSRSTCHP